MAFDDCLLARVIGQPDNVLLRLYTWSPGTITIGYHQDADRATDPAQLGTTPVVRRITGGRAVYHDPSELTYAIACRPEAIGIRSEGRVAEVYTHLARALGLFLNRLGVTADLVARSTGGSSAPDFFHKAPCFASAHGMSCRPRGARLWPRAAAIGWGDSPARFDQAAGIGRHPALDAASDTLQPLAKEDFDRLAATFVQVMTEEFGVEFRAGNASDMVLECAMKHRKTVAQKPLDRRDIVKQLLEPNSL